MLLDPEIVEATDVFEVEEIDGAFPFNLSIRKKREAKKLPGPGVYFITYPTGKTDDRETIYIGKYQPFDRGANLFSVRINKHMQTFTLRGKQVGFGTKRQERVLECANNIDLRKTFENILNDDGERMYRLRDTGTVASNNRIRFASSHWEKFAHETENLLHGFRIHYFRLDRNEIPDGFENHVVSEYESACIEKVQPRCNGNVNPDTESDARNTAPKVIAYEVLDEQKETLEDIISNTPRVDLTDSATEEKALPREPAHAAMSEATFQERFATREMVDKYSELAPRLQDQVITVLDWLIDEFNPDFYETDVGKELCRAGIREQGKERAKSTLCCLQFSQNRIFLERGGDNLRIAPELGRTQLVRLLDNPDPKNFWETSAAKRLCESRARNVKAPVDYQV